MDATLKVDHSRTLTVTEHAVESGSSVADHSYLDPASVTLEMGMSDSGTERRSGGNRSINAFKALQNLQATRQPFTVATRLATYPNMLIVSLGASDDYTTANALKATVILQEIRIVKTSTVLISGRTTQLDASKTSVSNSGTKQAAEISKATNQSVLAGIASKAGGLLSGLAR